MTYVKVNSNSLVDADHHRAVAVLKEAGNSVTMVVAREKLSSSAPSSRTTPATSSPNNSNSEVEIKAEVGHGLKPVILYKQ